MNVKAKLLHVDFDKPVDVPAETGRTSTKFSMGVPSLRIDTLELVERHDHLWVRITRGNEEPGLTPIERVVRLVEEPASEEPEATPAKPATLADAQAAQAAHGTNQIAGKPTETKKTTGAR